MRIPLPPLPRQRAIADYLDRETGRLDALVAAKRRLLELLAEKRRALIAQAVIRGLEPGVRDSGGFAEEENGAATVGDRGVRWAATKLKYVARFRYGDALLLDESDDCQFRAFGSNGPYTWASTANTESPAIVIGRKGSYGKINWTAEKCFASDTTFFVDSTTCNHNLRWLYYLLQTLKLDEGTDEAAVPGLNREAAYAKEVLVPPYPQQRAIADYLDRETGRLDALAGRTRESVALLRERRAALISAAVGGRGPGVSG